MAANDRSAPDSDTRFPPRLGDRVLVSVIDDETGHRERALGLHGDLFEVVSAYSTVEEFLDARPTVEVVLLDLWIRIGDRPLRGLPAVRKLADAGYRILLHSMDERRNVLAALGGAGANGFVSKASSTQDLVAALEAVARGEDVLLTTKLAGLADELGNLGALVLTGREAEVLRFRARGMSVPAIATATHYSVPSVERHITSLNRKVKAFLQEYEAKGVEAPALQPAAHVIAKLLGYGPGDLLEPPG